MRNFLDLNLRKIIFLWMFYLYIDECVYIFILNGKFGMESIFKLYLVYFINIG